MKLIKSLAVILFVLLIILLIASIYINASFHQNDQEILSALRSKANLDGYELGYIENNKNKMRFVKTIDTMSALVLYLHGAPGNLMDFENYITDPDLLASANAISVDRLGYAGSRNGGAVETIDGHVAPILKLLEGIDYNKITIVGHSYGCAVAGQLAFKLMDKVQSVILLAPVIDPENEKRYWFTEFLESNWIKKIIGSNIKSAIIEKETHPLALSQIKENWSKIDQPVFIIHCKNDKIAPYTYNIEFAKKHIKTSRLNILDGGEKDHFIPWNDFERVKKLILSQLN